MKTIFTLKDSVKYIIFIGIVYTLMRIIPSQNISTKDKERAICRPETRTFKPRPPYSHQPRAQVCRAHPYTSTRERPPIPVPRAPIETTSSSRRGASERCSTSRRIPQKIPILHSIRVKSAGTHMTLYPTLDTKRHP